MTMTYPEKLRPLIAYLELLNGRPNVNELKSQLEAIRVSAEEMSEFVHFNETRYRRNKVFESEDVELLCLCWKSGQRSPIHDHAHSICGVKIIEGVATETIYEKNPSGYIKPTASQDYSRGCVMASQDEDTHQVANLQEMEIDLITLHIYSPPLRRMKTYSIDSKKTNIYEPVNEDHANGSGI